MDVSDQLAEHVLVKKKEDLMKKVPMLQTNGPVTQRENYNAYRTYQYKLSRLKAREPRKYRSLAKELYDLLDRIEKALNQEL